MTWVTRPPPSADLMVGLADILVVSILIYEVLNSFAAPAPCRWRSAAVCSSRCSTGRADPSGDGQLAVRNLVGYIVFARSCSFSRHPPRARAFQARAVLPLSAKTRAAEETIEELVVAAGMLSSQRVGAIIAVERQIGLRNYRRRHPARRCPDIRSSAEHLPAHVATA
jgi:hypothetical protein